MDSDLYYAVITDNVDALKKIEGRLKIGNQRTPTNNTVLHLACQYGNLKCVEEILSVHESLLSEINSRGETVLHLAAREGHYDVVVLLINAAKPSFPQPINLQNNTVPSTVVMAQNLIKSTDVEVHKPLTTEEEKQQAVQSTSADQTMCRQPSVDVAGPSSSQRQVITNTVSRLTILIRSTDSEGETALHLAVRYNRHNVVQLLVHEDPDNLYPQNNSHETPLYLASIRNYSDIISIILDYCKSPTFGGPEGRTALHAAVLSCGGECVKLLLLKGNTNLVEVQDDYGWTAFHFVAYNCFYKIVKVLVDAEDKYAGNKSVGYKLDKKKRIAFHVAAQRGAVRVMAELLKYYPDFWEIVDGSGRNVFHIAVEEKQKGVISYILSQGSTTSNYLLSQRDHKGNTPLHLIAKLAYYVPELMDEGKLQWKVDWEVTDNNNLTPLDVLQFKQETDTRAHLLSVAWVRRKLIYAEVLNHWNLRDTQKMSDLKEDVETGNRVAKRYDEINVERVRRVKENVNTQMIVAALVATVALTAGFAVPGGFDGNRESNQGYPQLLRKAAFKAFMITDTITVVSSISSLLLYFVSTMGSTIRFVAPVACFSGLLNVFSIITMMLTFGTGTYATLAPSSALAICVCVLSTFLFPLIFFVSFSLCQQWVVQFVS